MAMVILDREAEKDLIRLRREQGIDRFDEVWNGVYIMSPLANPEHQEVATFLAAVFIQALTLWPGVKVYAGLTVSDRREGWDKNFRCPDVAVVLPTNPGVLMPGHFFGGPDFAVEVVSRYDRSRKKLGFYAEIGVRELLYVDRYPWALEMFRFIDGDLKRVGRVTPDSPGMLASEVLPVSFRLISGPNRPVLEVTQTNDARVWLV